MKTKILIILALFAILTSSCHKCRNLYPDYQLKDVDKQMMPYEKGQTVKFIDTDGKTFNFTVTKWSINTVPNHHCEGVETLKGKLASEQHTINFDFYMQCYEGAFVRVKVSKFSFELLYNKYGNFFTSNSYSIRPQYFHDSLEINNKIYYDVVERIKYDGYNVFEARILYNKTYGVLQYEDKNKVFLMIDN